MLLMNSFGGRAFQLPFTQTHITQATACMSKFYDHPWISKHCPPRASSCEWLPHDSRFSAMMGPMTLTPFCV